MKGQFMKSKVFTIFVTLILAASVYAARYEIENSTLNEKEKIKIKKEIQNLSQQKYNPLKKYVSSFCHERKFIEAQYAIEYIKKNLPKYFDQFEFDLCLLKIINESDEEGDKCLRNYYERGFGEYNKRKKFSKSIIMMDYEYYTISTIIENGYLYIFPIFDHIKKRMNRLLKEYPNMDENKRKYIKNRIEWFKQIEKKAKKRKELIALRTQQINSYLRQLEKLLVLKDENKLREFFEEYFEKDQVDKRVKYYKGWYFDKNLQSIKFEVIPDKYGRTYPIEGSENERFSIDFRIKTNPKTSGKECPQKVHADKEILYCQTFIFFKFDGEKMIVEK